MRPSALLNTLCLSSALVHTASFPPHQQAEVVLIFPRGFLFTVCWLAGRAREGVFQKLYSVTIDLQLNRDPAFLHQICDSQTPQTQCVHTHHIFMWFHVLHGPNQMVTARIRETCGRSTTRVDSQWLWTLNLTRNPVLWHLCTPRKS